MGLTPRGTPDDHEAVHDLTERLLGGLVVVGPVGFDYQDLDGLEIVVGTPAGPEILPGLFARRFPTDNG